MTNACTTVVASRDRCFRPGCDGAVPGGCTAARTDAVGALAGFDAACAAGPVGTCVVGRNDGAVDEIARGAIKQQQQLAVIDEKLANATGWHSTSTGNVKMLLNSLESSLNTYFRPSQSRSSFRGVRRPSRRGRSKSCCCAWCCHRSAILTIALVPLSNPRLARARAVGAGRLQAATGAVGHRAARGHHRWGR